MSDTAEMSRAIVLIAPADCIAALQEEPHLKGSIAFDDNDTKRALEVIRDQKPSVIALERSFVASLRGNGFIKQIKAEPELGGCDIQTVCMRRAPRHRLREKTKILTVDGPVTLLNVSKTGAQVLSTVLLKPRQRIRVTLGEGERPLLGIVVWSHFELPEDGPCYRAGIEFVSSALPAVAEFLSRIKP
jgi:hypothetical protein